MRAHRLAFSLAAAGAVTAAVTVPTVLATSAGRARPHLAATLYVSAAGSDAGRCTQRAPCASFGRAYAVASPGDTVLVGSGTYGDQTIGYDSSKSGDGCDAYDLPADVSGCVTFEAAPGATVSFAGEITIVGNGVRLVGFDLGANGVGINPGSVCHSPPTRGVVLDGLRSNGGKLAIDGASYVADVNGNWGNGDGESVIAHSCDSTGEGDWLEPTHLRFDHSWYHDVVQHTVGTSEHIECMHLDAADYVTIESSRFTNCAGYDLRIAYEHRSVESVSHYLIENSVFAATCSEQQVGVNCFPIAELELDCSGLAGTSCDSDVVRFNTIDGRFHPSVEEGSSGFTSSAFYGNVTTGGEDAYHCKTYLQTGMAYYDDVFGSVGEQGNPGVPCAWPSGVRLPPCRAQRAGREPGAALGQRRVSGDRSPRAGAATAVGRRRRRAPVGDGGDRAGAIDRGGADRRAGGERLLLLRPAGAPVEDGGRHSAARHPRLPPARRRSDDLRRSGRGRRRRHLQPLLQHAVRARSGNRCGRPTRVERSALARVQTDACPCVRPRRRLRRPAGRQGGLAHRPHHVPSPLLPLRHVHACPLSAARPRAAGTGRSSSRRARPVLRHCGVAPVRACGGAQGER